MVRWATSGLALGLAKQTLQLLIGLCCCAWLFYCVTITVSPWLHSHAYRSLTTHETSKLKADKSVPESQALRFGVFPFIADALPERLPVSHHREFSTAVGHVVVPLLLSLC